MLIEINRAKFAGEAYDASAYATRLAAAVGEVCGKQAEIGIDVVNDGKFAKRSCNRGLGGWFTAAERLVSLLRFFKVLEFFYSLFRSIGSRSVPIEKANNTVSFGHI
jgi:hypothetical protein